MTSYDYNFDCQKCGEINYFSTSERSFDKNITRKCHNCKKNNKLFVKGPSMAGGFFRGLFDLIGGVIGFFISIGIFLGTVLFVFSFFASCEGVDWYERPFCVFGDVLGIVGIGGVNDSVIDFVDDSIVFVDYNSEVWSGSGSGVIINNEDGKLLIYTNRHVVDCTFTEDCVGEDDFSVSIATSDSQRYDVSRVFLANDDVDLAILEVRTKNTKNYRPVTIASDFSSNIGDSVVAIGYPSFFSDIGLVEFAREKGKITGIRDVASSQGKMFRLIESNAYTSFGSSGGGLFNEKGELIGITTITGSNIFTHYTGAIDINSINQDDFIRKR